MPQLLNDYLDNAVQAGYIDTALQTALIDVASMCQIISKQVETGSIHGLLTVHGDTNVQGEVQKTLDILSNQQLLNKAEECVAFAAVASEEMEDIVDLNRHNAPYLLLFDPLDGSSNVEINVSIGTIFSILNAPQANRPIVEKDFLQAGRYQMASGYTIYGPQTMLILTIGQGVVEFTLDPIKNIWLMTAEKLTIPEDTQEFAINMSNMRHWATPVKRYIDDCLAGTTGCRGKNFNMRWIAAMVADVHRILHRGGIFMYPWDQRAPEKAGKLRLMYEANPMSFLIEQAGGASFAETQRILDVTPVEIHQRISVALGSKNEVHTLNEYYDKE